MRGLEPLHHSLRNIFSVYEGGTRHIPHDLSAELVDLVKRLRTLPDYAMRYLRAEIEDTFTPDIQDALRVMPYQKFLTTRYWLLVRALIFLERGARCERCQTYDDLDVHHLTYRHRGRELFHFEDLQILCHLCHEWTHTYADVKRAQANASTRTVAP